jgi:hypothetical protein
MKVAWLSALHTGHLYPKEIPWYLFLLEAECRRKGWVTQWPHHKSNPRTWNWKRSASPNCPTAYSCRLDRIHEISYIIYVCVQLDVTLILLFYLKHLYMFRAFLAHHQQILYCLIRRSLWQTKVWSCGMVSGGYDARDHEPKIHLTLWTFILAKFCVLDYLRVGKSQQPNFYVNTKRGSARWCCDPRLRSANSRWLASPRNSKSSSLFPFRT